MRLKLAILFLLLFPVIAYTGEVYVDGQSNEGHIIQDEGSTLAQQPILDFVGAGVTATNTGSKTQVSITATGSGDESHPEDHIEDTAYNATSWDGNLQAPTKNAIRDKIETLGNDYLKLDQTTPQNVTSGQPDFNAGLRAGSTDQLSIDASGNLTTTGYVVGSANTDTLECSGFTTAGVAASTLSWVDGALGATRTFTITGAHDIYINGVKSTKPTASIQIADTTGTHWIYYNASGVLSESTTIPAFNLPFIATVYWNTTLGFDKGILGAERHGIAMDWKTHNLLHSTVGTRFESGLTGTFADTTFSIALGKFWDEDIQFDIGAQTTCDVFYKNGAADYEWATNQTVYYYTSGGNLYWNNGNTLTAAGANKYVAVWIFATNNNDRPIVALIGQNVSDTIAAARSVNTYEGLSLGSLPFQEMKLLYRVILRNDVTPYEEAQDYRSISNVPAGTYVATDHGVLTGLTDDDHPQYWVDSSVTTRATNYATTGSLGVGAITGTGAQDFGGATSLEIPNGTSGTTDATGETYLDTNGDGGINFSGEVIQIYTGAANKYLFPMALPLAASQDNFVPKYDASTKTVSWEAEAGGTGDISSVGDVASGAAFDGTQGTTLTFYNVSGNKTLAYDNGTKDFELSDDLTISDTDPHIKWNATSGDDFEAYVYDSEWFLQNMTDGIVARVRNSDNTIITNEEHCRCAYVEDLVAADDNKSLGAFGYPVTITGIGASYIGTGTTKATLTLEDGAGNAMTITGTNPTVVAEGTDFVFAPVTANNTLNIGEIVRFDVTNTTDPITDDYTICIKYKKNVN